MRPFEETRLEDNFSIRIFYRDVDERELKWHWDEEDRTIEALNENDWMFQFDNRLPIKMEMNAQIFIHAGDFHRVIKGNTDLVLRIKKHPKDSKGDNTA
jgi:hypothetical protein